MWRRAQGRDNVITGHTEGGKRGGYGNKAQEIHLWCIGRMVERGKRKRECG